MDIRARDILLLSDELNGDSLYEVVSRYEHIGMLDDEPWYCGYNSDRVAARCFFPIKSRRITWIRVASIVKVFRKEG